MLIIGFGNKARHGKDTAAQAIKDYYDRQIENTRRHLPTYRGTVVGIFRFADALYQEVNQAIEKIGGGSAERLASHIRDTGMGFVDDNDWVKATQNPVVSDLAPYGKHPALLQWWGTNYRRKQDVNYWVKKTFSTIPENINIALIADTRFINEAEGVKERGGFTVNVSRLQESGAPYVSSDRPADHPSEIDLDSYNWDYRLLAKTGQTAWVGEQAITLVQFLLGWSK